MIELDSHGVNSVPVASARNPSGAPPPGFSRISNATPPRMNPVLSVTITSGTRDTTTRRPFTAPTKAPAQRIATEAGGIGQIRVLHRPRGEHVRDRHHRAYGKIDAAGNYDQGLRRGGERQRQRRHRQRLGIERIEVGVDSHGRRQERDQQRRHAEQRGVARNDAPGSLRQPRARDWRSGLRNAVFPHELRRWGSTGAPSPCAARSRVPSSAPAAGISSTTLPPNKTMARSQAKGISVNSDVNSSTAEPAAASSRTSA